MGLDARALAQQAPEALFAPLALTIIYAKGLSTAKVDHLKRLVFDLIAHNVVAGGTGAAT